MATEITGLTLEALGAPSDSTRISGLALEVVRGRASNTDITGLSLEAAGAGPNSTRIAGLLLELVRNPSFDTKITGLSLEGLGAGPNSTRIAGLSLEALGGGPSSTRVSGLSLEVVRDAAIDTRITGLSLEALGAGPGSTRVSGLVLEVVGGAFVNPPPQPIPDCNLPAELLACRFWVFELDLGEKFYFADAAQREITELGEVVLTEGLGPIEWESRVGLNFEVAVRIDIQSNIDWAAIRAKGIVLERRPGRLWRVAEGRSWDERKLFLDGVLTDIEYGSVADGLQGSLLRIVAEDNRPMPDVQAVIDGETWPATVGALAIEESQGKGYPLIFGYPGGIDATPIIHTVPVVVAEDTTPVATGGLTSPLIFCERPLHATAVKVANHTQSPTAFADITVQERADKLGRTVAYGDFVGNPGMLDAFTSEFYAAFVPDAGFGGGIENDRGQPMRGAGDIIAFLFREFIQIPFDYGRFAAHRDALNAFLFDTWLNASTDPRRWLQNEILDFLPVVARQSTRGLYFELVRWDATVLDAVAFLSTARGELQRRSTLRTQSGRIENEISLKYQQVRTTGTYRQTRTVSAVAGQLSATPAQDQVRVFPNMRCRASQAIYRKVYPKVLKSKSIWANQTAGLVLHHRAARYALPKQAVEYAAPLKLEWIEPGMIVAITDPELHLTDRVALLSERVLESTEIGWGLTLLDELAPTRMGQ